MAEFPALPLFTDAYLGDTTHLTTIEHGAYLLLLMVAWRTKDCSLPNDDRLLARYARLTMGQWRRMKPTIMAFFREGDGGRIYQARLTDEHKHVRQVRESQAANGRASALKRKGRHLTLVHASDNEASTPTFLKKHLIEKEKETIVSKKKEKATHWPEGKPLPEDWIEWAMNDRGWTRAQADNEARRMIDYALAHGKTYTSWMAAWRNWCRSPHQKTTAMARLPLTV